MAFIGLAVTLLGFVVTLMSLGLASGVGARMVMAIAGMAISLFGIIGIINPAYLKHAIWRRL